MNGGHYAFGVTVVAEVAWRDSQIVFRSPQAL
jgi:hypothetical protein